MNIFSSSKKDFDPFQLFEVTNKSCYILTVKVLKGRNISKGWLRDMLDTPDPYVEISLSTSPSKDQKLPATAKVDVTDKDTVDKRTPAVDNNSEPVWNYTLSFLVDLQRTNILNIKLLDYNITDDEELGSDTLDLKNLEIGKLTHHTFKFDIKAHKVTAEVDVEFLLEEDKNPALRYSLCLCDEEKAFFAQRQKHVLEGLKELIGDKAPDTPSKVPVVAVLGSGGGFRAMTAYCGVMKALYESGLLDVVSYVAGLSGSAWYLSHLYSNPDWPECSPGDFVDELRESVTSSWTRHLYHPKTMYKYISAIKKKKKSGQPVSFTDFFGHIVAEVLIPKWYNAKLSEQAEEVKTGRIPMPIYSCVSVKSDMSAQEFHEWVEFTPFEIGMPKYGIFMKTPMFGCRFFLGRVLKYYPEPPLHYLQGIWGSAFTILLKRLVQESDDLTKKHPKGSRDEREQLAAILQADLEENTAEEEPDDPDESEENPSNSVIEPPSPSDDGMVNIAEAIDNTRLSVDDAEGASCHRFRRNSSPSPSCSPGRKRSERSKSRERPRSRSSSRSESPAEGTPVAPGNQDPLTFFEKVVNAICAKYPVLGSRKGRAAMVFNYLYGLELNQCYPLSPFAHLCSQEGKTNPFLHIFEPYDTEQRNVCLVDAGLSFNSPFPPLLRPQRNVDIILSFDFSIRPKDDYPPFKELKLAELWAKINHIPFPRIDEEVYEREGMKEVYVFSNPEDPTCPVVLHFPLANVSFRQFKEPGVRRETKEEKQYGDFSLFEDGSDVYSTFNFKYTRLAFNRLVNLMEYNVLNNIELIKTVIVERIKCEEKQRKTRMMVLQKAVRAMMSQGPVLQSLAKNMGIKEAVDGTEAAAEEREQEATSHRKKTVMLQNVLFKHVMSHIMTSQEEPE